VILELEWVSRYVANQLEKKVIECLAHLIALPGITVEDRDEIEAALGYCRDGIDFADAKHLAASKACTELRRFRRANGLIAISVHRVGRARS